MIKYLLNVCIITFYSYTTQAQQLTDCELDSIDGMEVMLIVEESPEYEGGYSQFYKDLKLPSHPAILYFSFVIDAEGNIRNFCSSAEIENLEELIENINRWKAGKQRGKKVPVRLTGPMHIKWG
ncbi:hypothetical protein [Chondrinema litorale]|uniref:hypothetical protein n=1 Tax=Chondrinema litorale TaxID=2994555 RepID=UPI002543AC1C|nr:hypothetical protein [Chondrinema litorale]UZR93655.1 hypothetical protein OQ292_17540 [Chondrinema litorale]